MRVNLRRRIAFLAALIVPVVAALALSASPALAALPRYGRLVVGAHNNVSPLAILAIALGAVVGLSLLVIAARRRPHRQHATVSPIHPASDRPVDGEAGGRRAA
jgi:hypothetical protein